MNYITEPRFYKMKRSLIFISLNWLKNKTKNSIQFSGRLNLRRSVPFLFIIRE